VFSRWTLERDEAGRPANLLAINTDITERKHLENQIHQHAERATAMAALSQALAEVGPDEQQLCERIARMVAATMGDLCLVTMLCADAQWQHMVAVDHADPEKLEFVQALGHHEPYRTEHCSYPWPPPSKSAAR
jgi:hypothetical protein